MRKTLTASLLACLALTLGGCMAGGAKPARTRLQGGESSLVSERLERRPVESRMVITAETAPAPPPAPAPTYIIRITPPNKPE